MVITGDTSQIVTSNKPTPEFYRPDVLPVSQQCRSTEWKSITIDEIVQSRLTRRSFDLVFDH